MLFAIVMLLYNNLLSKLVQEPLDNANTWYCGTIRNKIDPCGKLFGHVGGHNDVRTDIFSYENL